jgi:hypothetical protein
MKGSVRFRSVFFFLGIEGYWIVMDQLLVVVLPLGARGLLELVVRGVYVLQEELFGGVFDVIEDPVAC